MSAQSDRILGRLRLALSGFLALSVAVHWGAQLGLRPGFFAAAILTAQVAAPGPRARPVRPAAACPGVPR